MEPISPEAILLHAVDHAESTLSAVMQNAQELGPGYHQQKKILALGNKSPWYPEHSFPSEEGEEAGMGMQQAPY